LAIDFAVVCHRPRAEWRRVDAVDWGSFVGITAAAATSQQQQQQQHSALDLRMCNLFAKLSFELQQRQVSFFPDVIHCR